MIILSKKRDNNIAKTKKSSGKPIRANESDSSIFKTIIVKIAPQLPPANSIVDDII